MFKHYVFYLKNIHGFEVNVILKITKYLFQLNEIWN